MVLCLLIEPLGRVVGWGAYLGLTWTMRVVEWTACFPYASVPLELSDLGLTVVYAVITGLTGLARLEGILVYPTDEDSAVTISSDRHKL